METACSYKPVRFFVIANAAMWALWLAAAYLSYRPDGGPGGFISALEIAGLFTPFAAALWMIFTSGSPELKRNFYGKLFDLRAIRPWTLPAIFLIAPVSVVVSVALSQIFFNQPSGQLTLVQGSPFAAGIVPAQALLLLAPVVEEVGWKGYGMESLRGERSFLKATLIFAALWAFWHGPTFFVRDYYQNALVRDNPLFALNFILSFAPITVIFNWLWYKNRGNILTAVLCHGVLDLQGMLTMGQAAKCIQTGVLFVIAALIVGFDKKMFFAKFPPRPGDFGQTGAGKG